MPNPLVADAREFLHQFQDDDVPGLGAELAYRFLFAIFPFGIFLAAFGSFVAGWIGVQDPAQQVMSGLGDNLPQNLAGPVETQLQQVLGQHQTGLLSFGAVLALYAAAGGTNALIKAMGRAYDVPDTRPFILRYLWAIALTVLGGVGIIVSFVTVVGGSLLTADIARTFGLGSAWGAIALLRWPLTFVVLTVAVAIVYRYAPEVRPPWRWTLLGAAVFAVLWLVVTFGLAFYVANFGHYNATYGAIAGVIVLMLWFYLTSIVLVSCAELVAVLVRHHEPELLEERRSQLTERATAAGRDVGRRAQEAATGAAASATAGEGARGSQDVGAAGDGAAGGATADDDRDADEGASAAG